ncbi:two-component system sensor histidine kinase KdbD, partial [Salmonella enterica subsp. enterica serovar Oslo]|nr:two-component system sensor histidine kinase KdbD [Salmonella enterica subsp. enterica serovar Oslo]
YVETPTFHRVPENQRRALVSALRRAPVLGAETAPLADPAEGTAVVRSAREQDLGTIVMGRPASRRWWRRVAFAVRLASGEADLEHLIVALEEPPARAMAQTQDYRPFKEIWRWQFQGCLVAVALCAITSLIALQWIVNIDAANLVLL